LQRYHLILNSDHRLKVGPDKIYIQSRAIDYWLLRQNIVYTKRLSDTSIEYLRKDALLDWAKKKNKRIDTEDGDYTLGYVSAMIDLIEKIESL